MTERGVCPGGHGPSSANAQGQAAEQIGFRASGCEGEAHAACGFDDAGGDFDQTQTQS